MDKEQIIEFFFADYHHETEAITAEDIHQVLNECVDAVKWRYSYDLREYSLIEHFIDRLVELSENLGKDE